MMEHLMPESDYEKVIAKKQKKIDLLEKKLASSNDSRKRLEVTRDKQSELFDKL